MEWLSGLEQYLISFQFLIYFPRGPSTCIYNTRAYTIQIEFKTASPQLLLPQVAPLEIKGSQALVVDQPGPFDNSRPLLENLFYILRI